MSYKVKSLVYLACFITASFVYYGVEKENAYTNDASEIGTWHLDSNAYDKIAERK